MLIGDIMIDHWREIEKVLDRNLVSEADKARILYAYKALCWHWCEDAAKAGGHGSEWQREQWPDEWSVASM